MMIELNDVKIPTWTEPETLAYLKEIGHRSRFVVEVGTYMGASARAILQGNTCKLWCVDKFEVFGTRQITELFLREWIQSGRCDLIQGQSPDVLPAIPHMQEKLDAVWIDDGHAETDLIRDIRAMMPMLKKDGIMCGHDWEGNNDVARGVLTVLSRSQITFPVPRVWQFQKP